MFENYYSSEILAKSKIDDQERMIEHLMQVSEAKAAKKTSKVRSTNQKTSYRKRSLLHLFGL